MAVVFAFVLAGNLLVNATCGQDGGLGEPAGWTFAYPRGAAAVPAGTKRILDYVVFRPYYLEEGDDVEQIH